jgi:hypothetical protein
MSVTTVDKGVLAISTISNTILLLMAERHALPCCESDLSLISNLGNDPLETNLKDNDLLFRKLRTCRHCLQMFTALFKKNLE